MNQPDKKKLRNVLFRHLDGIVVAPTAFTLHEAGILEYLLKEKQANLTRLTRHFNANEGYLNVALRVLCAQGWLTQRTNNETDEISYQITERGAIAFELVHLYEDVVRLLQFSEKFHHRKFEKEPFEVWHNISLKYRNRYSLAPAGSALEQEIQDQLLIHIEGVLVGPTIVALGMGGMFHKYFMEVSFRPEEFHQDHESFGKLLDFFAFLGWFDQNNETFRFTELGLFYAKRATAYGVTVSYIPTFRKLKELIFGNPSVLRDISSDSAEIHVDRAMNVWGSGGAHTTYFKKVDEVIVSLFNKPIQEQPQGIVDMGCGNGAFLEHIYYVIESQTIRGKMLEEYPLFLVGADFNQAARKITRANLIQADIWAKVIWGDIARPDKLADDLKQDYGIELTELLNVRTFLDHNRPWEEPTTTIDWTSDSTGAFAFRGKRLNNNTVESNLLEHFKRWAPYVQKFGLLMIELHTIDPALTATNLGRTGATAYDATHGFSDQYIVEIDVMHRIAKEAGLISDPRHFIKYPDSDLATVSINLFKG